MCVHISKLIYKKINFEYKTTIQAGAAEAGEGVYTSPPPKMKILKFLVMKIGNNIY
jgi:hypothetical protein